jgi:hypothetical protein
MRIHDRSHRTAAVFHAIRSPSAETRSPEQQGGANRASPDMQGPVAFLAHFETRPALKFPPKRGKLKYFVADAWPGRLIPAKRELIANSPLVPGISEG